MLDMASARLWLQQQGVREERWCSEILGGFARYPIYEQDLSPGDVLYQFVRNPSLGDMSPGRGSWFGLAGASQDSVAIIGGGAGRRLHKFKVTLPALALEGVAARMPIDWKSQVGGAGGATQLFIPPNQIARVRPVGAAQ